MSSPISSIVELIAEQSFMLHLESGDRLRVLGGRLQVRPAPEWLGERMVARDAMYRIGEIHVADRRGHVTVTAMDSACVAEVTRAGGRAVRLPRFRRLAWIFARRPARAAIDSE